MDIEDPRHLSRPPRAFGRAAGFAVVILLALWGALARLEGLEELAVLLFLGLVGIWGMAAMLRVDHRLMDLIAIVGLVLAILSVLQSLGSETEANDKPAAAASTTTTTEAPATTTTTRQSATTASTTTPTTAAPTTATPTTALAAPAEAHLVSFAHEDDTSTPYCLDAPTAVESDDVQIAPCTGSARMEWELADELIRRPDGSLCIALPGEAVNFGDIVTATCNADDPGQQWSLIGEELRNAKGGCLDVHMIDDGRTVQMWEECDNSDEQRWRFD